MKAILETEKAIVKRVSLSQRETASRIYLPKSWEGRLVVIIPLSFEGKTLQIDLETGGVTNDNQKKQ